MTTVTFQEGSSYQGTIDTFLYQADPDLLSGNDTVVWADAGSGVTREGLLEFTGLFGDAPGQIPIGATITSATLTLDTTNPSGGKIQLYRMLTDWSEDSTWNSLGNGVQLDGIEALATADSVVGRQRLGSSTIDVTDSLQAWLSGASTPDQANQANLGWVLETGNTNGWTFSSSETSAAPILTVTYSTTTVGDGGASQLALAGPVTQNEGTSSNPTEFIFTVERTGDLSGSASAHYAVSGIRPMKAAAGDFQGGHFPSGTVTFAPGEASKTIVLNVKADSGIEGNDTFKVVLSSPSAGATITEAKAVGTIVNDDFPFGIVGVHLFDASAYGAGYPSSDPNHYGSTDPTDMVYDPTTGSFFLCDSEIDESPYHAANNLWQLDGSAGLEQAISLDGFSHEPTGLALWVDPSGGKHLFISDDDQDQIFEVDPANPTVVLHSFSTLPFGCTDPEDLSINPNNGNLFVLSEKNFTIYEISQDGQTVVSTAVLPDIFRMPKTGTPSLEGLVYDAADDQFFVSGGFSPNIYVISRTGEVLQTINLLKHYPNTDGAHVYPKGMELAPSSDGSGHMSLWVTDYGKDQVPDGRVIEIVLDRPASDTPSLAMLSATDTQSAALAATLVTDHASGHKHHFAESAHQLFADRADALAATLFPADGDNGQRQHFDNAEHQAFAHDFTGQFFDVLDHHQPFAHLYFT
jgi:hypothetical protein